MTTRVSGKDVAARARVSVATVSNVVNSPDIVSAATRARVQQAIDDLGWVPHEPARQLRAGLSRSIGIVVPDIANPFYAAVVETAEQAVTTRGYFVQIGNSGQSVARQRAQLRLLARQRVRAVLLAPINGIDEEVAALRRQGVVVVVIGPVGPRSDLCSVSVDDVAGGRLAVEHLIEKGHRRIALVGGRDTVPQIRQRRQGAAERAACDPNVELLTLSSTRLDVSSGLGVGAQLVSIPSAQRPTAVFAANDLVALGVLHNLTEAGIRVPDDIAVVGYDDIEFGRLGTVPISTVRQSPAAVVRHAVELLTAEIRSHGAGHDHRRFELTPELVVRRSSCRRFDRPATSFEPSSRTLVLSGQ